MICLYLLITHYSYHNNMPTVILVYDYD